MMIPLCPRPQVGGVYVATAADIAILRRCAAVEADPALSEKSVLLEPGRWAVPAGAREGSINIALETADPEWRDVDLADYASWSEFRSGIPLTVDGRAIVDFSIRRRGDRYKDLHGNITAYVLDGQLCSVRGTSRKLWEKACS